jgi:hypothetical protein
MYPVGHLNHVVELNEEWKLRVWVTVPETADVRYIVLLEDKTINKAQSHIIL